MDSKVVSYLENQDFREAMRDLQIGNWQEGLEKLQGLEQVYPLEHDLRTLRQEMMLRARMDGYETEDQKRERWLALLNGAKIVLAGVVLVLLVIWGVNTYSTRIRAQWAAARQQVEDQMYTLGLAAKFRNAQNLLQADRPVEAKALFGEIYAEAPDYPQLDTFMAETEKLIARETAYTEAVRKYEAGDLTSALLDFQAIQERTPYYQDVDLRIQQIQKELKLEDQLVQAVNAFSDQRWLEAITGFEALIALNPNFKRGEIEQFLYDSYLGAAQDELAIQNPTLSSLETAENYFQKALALRPQDQDVLAKRAQARASLENYLVATYIEAAHNALLQEADSLDSLRTAEGYFNKALQIRPGDQTLILRRDLARKYVDAIDNLTKGLWDKVISDLEQVYAEDKNYAAGTARQTLYEAYMARGKSELASGLFLFALADFQRAAVLAEESPESLLRLIEAQLKVAYTQGVLRNYQEAVLIYQSAIEKGGLTERARTRKAGLYQNLAQAQVVANNGDWESAYYIYRDALRDNVDIYERTTYTVQSGDYLTSLARQYNSTVEAILSANGISDLSKILEDQVIVIPNLP